MVLLSGVATGLVARAAGASPQAPAVIGRATTQSTSANTASLSATVGGMAAEHLGYAAAFLVLAGIALR